MRCCFARPRYGLISVGIAAVLAFGCESNSDLANPIQLKKVTIDEVLARPDLPEKARQAFLRRKEKGQTTFIAREVDAAIALAMKVDPRLEQFRSKFGSGEFQLPSYSKFTPPKSFEYPKEAQEYLKTFKGKFEFYRIGVEHFRKTKIDKLSAADKKKVAKFMNSVIDAMPYEGQKDIWVSLDHDGGQLLATHSLLAHEPMFLSCYGIAAGKNKDAKKANELLRLAIDEFAIHDYPTRCAALAYRHRLNFGTDSETHKQKNDYYVQRGLAMKYWLENDFRATPREHRYVVDQFNIFFAHTVRNGDSTMLNPLIDSIKKNEQLAPWTKAMLLGHYQFQVGVAARGSGYSHTVSDEGWDTLEKRLRIAAKHFREAYRINPRCADAASGLVQISTYGHTEESGEYWYEKATEHAKSYVPVYLEYSRSLQPKWGGSWDEYFDFVASQAKACLDSDDPIAGDPAIIGGFLEAMIRLFQDFNDEQELRSFFGQADRSATLFRAIDDLIDNNHEVVINRRIQPQDYLLTLKAMFASSLGELDRAEEAFRRLDGYNQDAARLVRSAGASFEMDRAYAYVLNNEFQVDAAEFKELVGNNYETRHKNRKEILPIADRLAEYVSKDKGGSYFQKLADQIRFEHEFAQGNAVDLTFTPEFRMWNIRNENQVKYESPKSIVIDNRKGDMAFLMTSLLSLRGGKQIDCDITFPSDGDGWSNLTAGLENSSEMAITFGTVAFGNRSEVLLAGLKRDNNKTTLKQPSRRQVRHRRGKLVHGAVNGGGSFGFVSLPMPKAKNHLSLRFNDRYIEMYVNGEFVCRTWSYAHRGSLDNPRIMIPAQGPSGRGIVRVSNINVKPWTPPPLALEDEKIVKHYEQAIKDDPQNQWAEFWLGHIFHRMGSYDKAIEHYKKSITLGVRESHVAFFIGDIYDRQKDWDQAKKWYQTSVENAPAHYPDTIRIIGRLGSGGYDSYPEDWARFRLAWVQAMRAGNDLKTMDRSDAGQMRVAPAIDEMIDLLEFQHWAARENWDWALRHAQRKLKKKPEVHQPLVKRMIEAYQNQEVFQGTEADARLYLDIDGGTPFFRHYEDRFSTDLSRLYRRIPMKTDKAEDVEKIKGSEAN